MDEKVLQVTSIETLQKESRGALIELPPFTEGGEFIARLRRPSMLALAKTGKIPNELLRTANTLFEDGLQGGFDALDDGMLAKMFEVLDVICEETFVEPTLKQLKEAKIELTDEQYMAIFNYTQNGVNQLKSFRG